jgi:hypothetical protein
MRGEGDARRFQCQTAKALHSAKPLFSQALYSAKASHSRGAGGVRALKARTLQKREGAGKTGHRLVPMVRVQKKSTRQNHRLSRGYPAFPAQWLYGLLCALPGDRALLPPSPPKRARCALWEFSASVGAPGPHSLAVREAIVRPHSKKECCDRSRPPLPASTSVTIAKRPLHEAG